jgi:cell division protein FtsN
MKKSAVIALFAFAMLPFSACSSNSDQAAYMTSSTAEENAREAEQAEQEFAQLASKEEETPKSRKAEKHGKHEEKVTEHKAEKKTKTAEKKTEHKTVEHKAEHKTEHKTVEHKAEHKTEHKAEHKTAEHKAVEHKTEHKTEHREPASAHPTKHAADGQRVYTVQLGAFRVKENAEKLTAKLKGEGFPVMMVGKEGSKSGELYLVHLEPTPNKSEAAKWQSDLKLKSFDSTVTSKRD